MPLEILNGNDVPTLMSRAQAALGDDAIVLSVRRVTEGNRFTFEMVAADPATAERHRFELEHKRRQREMPANVLAAASTPIPARMRASSPSQATTPAPTFWDLDRTPATSTPVRNVRMVRPLEAPELTPSRGHRSTATAKPRLPWPFAPAAEASRPRVIALVGPTGAGKTTTLAKLANHELGFSGKRVGLVCLDTYRVGAIEQSRHYAELSRMPFEVVWERSDVPRVLKRMRDRDIILVDTPGRGPHAAGDLRDVQARLVEMLPDEVHLVLPAGLDRVAARRVITAHLALGVTHLLPSKLDEHPGADGGVELAMQFGLPMRWLTDGQEVPRDLQAAPDLTAARARARQAVGAA